MTRKLLLHSEILVYVLLLIEADIWSRLWYLVTIRGNAPIWVLPRSKCLSCLILPELGDHYRIIGLSRIWDLPLSKC